MIPLGLVLPFAEGASAQAPRLTEAETSDWARMTSDAGVLAFLSDLQTLTPNMLVEEIGTTGLGRPILAVFLGDPVSATAAGPLWSDKPTVLITGSIHGDEPVGREAGLQLIRELTVGAHQELLRTVNVIVVPQMNPDGAEANTRENAGGYDLNRDWVTAETPEVGAVLDRLVTRFWPDVFLDVHNGGAPPYHLTYQTSLEPAADPDLVAYARGPVFDAVQGRLSTVGMRMYWYSGPIREESSSRWSWRTTEPWPRKQHSYGGLRDMMALLYEIPEEHPVEIGVAAAFEGMIGLVEFVASRPDEVRGVVREARRRTLEEPLDSVYLELVSEAYPEPEEFYVIAPGPNGGPVQTRLVEGVNQTLYVPSRTRSTPWGYAFDGRLTQLAAFLRRHGVQVERTLQAVTLPVGRYWVVEVGREEDRYHNHRRVRLGVEVEPGEVALDRGSYLVRVQQPAGRLVPQLLEPDAVDSAVRWNFFDAYLPVPREEDSYLPAYRLEGPPGVPTVVLP
jgi:hypothetical protein